MELFCIGGVDGDCCLLTRAASAGGVANSPLSPLHDALHRVLARMYKPRAFGWESVLMTQRLLLAMLVTLASSVPIVRAFLTTFVCAAALVRLGTCHGVACVAVVAVVEASRAAYSSTPTRLCSLRTSSSCR